MPPRRSLLNQLGSLGRLLAACAVIAALWLGVWPALSRRPAIRAAIERNRALGIDPSAKFYTEQEANANALIAIESARRRAPAAWRRPAFGK
jgi:hypothetical protein